MTMMFRALCSEGFCGILRRLALPSLCPSGEVDERTLFARLGGET